MAKAVPEVSEPSSSPSGSNPFPYLEHDLATAGNHAYLDAMAEAAWNDQAARDAKLRPFSNGDVVLAVGLRGVLHFAKVEAVDRMDAQHGWRVRFQIPQGHSLAYGVSSARLPGHESNVLVSLADADKVLSFIQRREPKPATTFVAAGDPLIASARWEEEMQELGVSDLDPRIVEKLQSLSTVQVEPPAKPVHLDLAP